MAFCILRGDSFRSFAMEGREVFRMVESSICIKIAVARMSGSIFFTEICCGLVSVIGCRLEVSLLPDFFY
jgi:hypothetical protein